jgi:hypothetical protein
MKPAHASHIRTPAALVIKDKYAAITTEHRRAIRSATYR